MTADERNVILEDQLKRALERVQLLEEQLAAAQKGIEELEKQKTPPPVFAKAKVKKPEASEKKPRKKREAEHNHGRRREVPTRMIEHRIVSCPVCASQLGGGQRGAAPTSDRVTSPSAGGGDRACGLSWLV